MKYHVQVATHGVLPFEVISPTGTVISTFRSKDRADRTVALLNDEPTRNTPEYWFKALNKELAHVFMSPVTERNDRAND